ncbi:LuxR C-terminal-related transcriptional regulator [Patulibacter sp. NPDC049589]|uniref:helix-turn-helix transcriptional regulator n=1 Tax=Patulibacter sp. NPDC049589 TaxID=3154731 RepID=UPI003419019F
MTVTASRVPEPRSLAAAGRPSGRVRRDHEILGRLRQIRALMVPALAACAVPPPVPLDGTRSAAGVAEELTRACVGGLSHPAAMMPGGHADLGALIAELHELAAEIHAHDRERRDLRMASCTAALHHLRSLSSHDLADAACAELAVRLELRRVSILRDDDGTWVPWATHAAGVAPAGRRADDAHDRDLLRHDLGDGPGVLVAPIRVRGRLLGLLHVEPHAGGEVDDELLAVVADGFGRIYDRAAEHDRLRAQRERIRRVIADVEAVVGPLTDTDPGIGAYPWEVAAPAASEPSTADADSRLASLTPRQREILRMMLGGASNGAIGTRLGITEGTVKSHVKRVLRKLGVVNRSQAIATFLPVLGAESR